MTDRDQIYALAFSEGTRALDNQAGTLGVQLPRFQWKFHMSPAVIVHAYADGDPPASTSDTHRALALFIDANIKHNKSNLNRCIACSGSRSYYWCSRSPRG